LSRTGAQSKSDYLIIAFLKLIFTYDSRCTALPKDLDGLAGRRTRNLREELIETLSSAQLWDEYGIDDDVVVCLPLLLALDTAEESALALYTLLSTSRHPRNAVTRSLASAYKGDI
jgi:hypothetical protein